MMYTTGNGERRIRIINFRYLVSQKLESTYDSIDYLAVANVINLIYLLDSLPNLFIKAL